VFTSDFFSWILRGEVVSSKFLLRFLIELLALLFLSVVIDGSLPICLSGVLGYTSSLS